MEHKKAKKAKKMAEDAMRMMALEDAMAEAGEADLQNQVMSGNIDEYANIRMRQGDTRIEESAAMPSDLDASYLKLNLPGSPLPTNGLLAPQNIIGAQQTQDMIRSEEQMFLARFIPAAGLSQLPVGQPPLESEQGGM